MYKLLQKEYVDNALIEEFNNLQKKNEGLPQDLKDLRNQYISHSDMGIILRRLQFSKIKGIYLKLSSYLKKISETCMTGWQKIYSEVLRLNELQMKSQKPSKEEIENFYGRVFSKF